MKCFLEDGDQMWMGSNGGLSRIVNRKGTYEEKTYTPKNNVDGLPGKKVSALFKDDMGTIWVGTQEFGLGKIIGYDKNNAPVFKNYPPLFGAKGALQNERVSCIFQDSKKRLWVGTYKGLHLYNKSTDDFICFVQTADELHSLSNNTILSMAEDKLGNLWVGTQFGLNKISGMANGNLVVNRITSKDGLPNDYIHAVQADEKNRIWVSTNKGICSLNPDLSISVFDKRDGVLSNGFSENATYKTSQGLLLFGGVEGLTYFNPDSIHISRFAPPVYFTNLRINNAPYEFGKSQPEGNVLSKPFNETNAITLNYTQNIISIDFASLDYHAPDKNEYTYMLEGFNKQWVMAGNKRTVSYTNFEPGNYTFKIRATNSDKVWNSETRLLQIKILPPPWKTWWAYCLYTLVFAFLLWYSRHLGLKQVRLKNQLQLAEVDRKQEHDLTRFKTDLFTNISHEFRTPLTLILGPIDDLLRRNAVDAPVKKSIRMIQKQSKRLLRMVNQLLDFQKAEAGSLRLNAGAGEVVSFADEIFGLFKDEARRKQIDYNFEFNERFISLSFDADKLEIVIYNLLSNAFKFTPSGGSITLSVKRDQSMCIISVSDNGVGISAEDKLRIFDRFYQGKKKMDATTISGTGIGLSFVKELTELHGGTIQVESDTRTGSTFIVRLPLQKKEDIVTSVRNKTNLQSALAFNNKDLPHMNNSNELQTEDLPIILVVEDDADVNDYVCEILAAEYTVVSSANGKDGLEKAFELVPDIIVSDVMMPEMDGIELCRMVKSDPRTSHIPVILLTALTDTTHHIKGIREGADVYLPKPFNSQLLLVHVHNLISTRQKLKVIYAKKIFLEPLNLEVSSSDESFLASVIKHIEENIGNPDFHNDELAYAMNMSRSTFYRKLKAVAGFSGTEFIRSIRLKYASKLLSKGGHTVNEAAYEAGFNDIKYFRKCFNDQFGVNPSEYKGQMKT